MLRFCVNAGPAFIISAVGAGMLGNVRAGAVLFAAHILAALLMGLGGRIWDGRSKEADREEGLPAGPKRLPTAAAFVESVNGRLPVAAVYVRLCGAVRGHPGPVRRFRFHGADPAGVGPAFSFGRRGCGRAELSVPLPAGGKLRGGGGLRRGRAGAAAAGDGAGLGRVDVHCQLAANLHAYKVMTAVFSPPGRYTPRWGAC